MATTAEAPEPRNIERGVPGQVGLERGWLAVSAGRRAGQRGGGWGAGTTGRGG